MKLSYCSIPGVLKAASLSLMLFLASCEDHRVPPTEQSLPDRIFYALSDDNQLHEINVRNTGAPMRSFAITNLESGDMLAGIDFRPATGQLYAISKQSNLYHINVKTGDQQGRATRIGTAPIATALTGSSVGFDFNPTVDKIRVVTSDGQNLRLNPETGAVLAGDQPLNGYSNPRIGGAAYTNSRAGVTAAPAGAGTTLYDIDPETDMLYIQNPPNPGALVGVGSLGLNITEVGGFDISPDVNASDVFPVASVKVDNKWELDYVNLTTGKLQKLGDLPAGKNIVGIAIPSMPVAYALEASNVLRIFNPTNGMMYGSKTVSIPGVMLEGIDIRPLNGALYALGNDSKIYSIDLGSGVATMVTSLRLADNTPVTLSGTNFGVDFNPVADRLRVVSNTGQNLRIDLRAGATLGVTVLDGSLKIGSAAGATPFITAVAYTNSYAGTTATTLFDIDSQSNTLYTQMPPNDGILVSPKTISADVEAGIGFDIGSSTGLGYTIFTVGGATKFYTFDVNSASMQEKFNLSAPVKGLAVGFGL